MAVGVILCGFVATLCSVDQARSTSVMETPCPMVQCTSDSVPCSMGGGPDGMCPTCIDPENMCMCPDNWDNPACMMYGYYMIPPQYRKKAYREIYEYYIMQRKYYKKHGYNLPSYPIPPYKMPRYPYYRPPYKWPPYYRPPYKWPPFYRPPYRSPPYGKHPYKKPPHFTPPHKAPRAPFKTPHTKHPFKKDKAPPRRSGTRTGRGRRQ